jgi:hypothetical protein
LLPLLLLPLLSLPLLSLPLLLVLLALRGGRCFPALLSSFTSFLLLLPCFLLYVTLVQPSSLLPSLDSLNGVVDNGACDLDLGLVLFVLFVLPSPLAAIMS